MDRIAESFETSPLQEAFWLSEPDGPSARLQAVLELRGEVDESALCEALTGVVARHEILRTTFATQPGIRVPVQAVSGSLAPAWSTHDLSGLDPATARARVLECRQAELEADFDLRQGPLLRAALVTLAPDRRLLAITVSGLCADPASLSALAGDLLDGYLGTTPSVPEPLQYADFAAWQRELASSDEAERQAADEFWHQAAQLASPLLPLARATAGDGATDLEVSIDPALAGRLADAGARFGADTSAVVQAAWQLLLGRLTGEESITIAYLSVERRHGDLDGAVGAFSRPVPVSVRLSATTTFAEVLGEVHRAREQALVRQDYAPTHGLPSPDIGFVGWAPLRREAPGLSATLSHVSLRGGDARLHLLCACTDQELRLTIGSQTGYLTPDAAGRLGEELQTLLGSVAADPGAPVLALDVVGRRERAQVIDAFNDTAAAVGHELVHELVAAHATRAPQRLAAHDGHAGLSYGELETRANQLAHRLKRTGVSAGAVVGLCTDRSVDMLVGLLGILKAGAAYLPVHPDHPPARVAHQLSGAGAVALVSQSALREPLAQFEGEVIWLDSEHEALQREPADAPQAPVHADDLAYVIYTSGSTGTPKGVGVTHANLRNYATFIAERLDATQAPRSFGMVTALSTDLGNTSVFGALASGGTLVIAGSAVAADAGALVRQFAQTPVDILKITPSHIGALLAGGDRGVLPRRTLVLGGERATWDLIARVRGLAPELELINHYGPTEATIGCATFTVGEGPGPFAPATVPIGRPIANSAIYVLDDRNNPMPIGVAGRLVVSGAGVARGYLGDAELTAQRFVADPFRDGARIYDTGDVGRWLPDGTLEFLGRVDEQVKIRGYRVEPAEVESALRTHPQVREAVVVAAPGASGETQLIAYCVFDGSVGVDALRRHLEEWVPEYMLPAAIVSLDALPQTPSGKIDRRALPDPATVATESGQEHVAPRTPMESAVAEIWSRVLGIESIGVHEDFFVLGGHSLLATQVVAQVRSDFAIELPLHSLFTYPTVESLTAEIVRMMGDSDEDETARLLAELEGLSDEDAERLLAGEDPHH